MQLYVLYEILFSQIGWHLTWIVMLIINLEAKKVLWIDIPVVAWLYIRTQNAAFSNSICFGGVSSLKSSIENRHPSKIQGLPFWTLNLSHPCSNSIRNKLWPNTLKDEVHVSFHPGSKVHLITSILTILSVRSFPTKYNFPGSIYQTTQCLLKFPKKGLWRN